MIKALDLGYTSNKPAPNWMTRGLTPNWDMLTGWIPGQLFPDEYMKCTWIPEPTLYLILQLWAVDIAESIIPIWENWAKNSLPECTDICREILRNIRSYLENPTAENLFKIKEMEHAVQFVNEATHYEEIDNNYEPIPQIDAFFAANRARLCILSSTKKYIYLNALFALEEWATSSSSNSTELWVSDLYKRLDRVSPWWVNP